MSNKRLTKRKCEMWISNNKVLVGSNKKHARNPNFETEETRLLISLWGDPKVRFYHNFSIKITAQTKIDAYCQAFGLLWHLS